MKNARFPPILDLPGVADLLGISIEEARRLAGEGHLAAAEADGRGLFHRDLVLKWLRAQRVRPLDYDPADAPI